jgi:hypothetical protein
MRDSDNYFTKRTLDYAKRTVQEDLPRPIKFKKINWSIVCTSHDVCKVRGLRGHIKRQRIRDRLWKKVQYQNPMMKKTFFEYVFGVWWVYKIKKIFWISD